MCEKPIVEYRKLEYASYDNLIDSHYCQCCKRSFTIPRVQHLRGLAFSSVDTTVQPHMCACPTCPHTLAPCIGCMLMTSIHTSFRSRCTFGTASKDVRTLWCYCCRQSHIENIAMSALGPPPSRLRGHHRAIAHVGAFIGSRTQSEAICCDLLTVCAI